jgi:cytochrome P450
MRLYPPAPGMGRRAHAPDRIGDYDIPEGADVAVFPWVTHRHPDFWPEPERFDPDRFTPEREAERHRHAYFPFGAGPRACIGQYFSMLEATIVLAMIARRFEVTSTSERPPVRPGITLQPTAGVPVRLRRRAGALLAVADDPLRDPRPGVLRSRAAGDQSDVA